ncbi:MAG: AAA family ATPase [Deltaproteobacteria bacterium]|nr:AAA family ATPase [Deltaproteobacteria bacterium]
MKRLPDGIADFTEIITGNYIYADKTRLLHKLLSGNTPYFLSRPRRFGKTLLLSALEAILEGKRELFKGLWIGSSNYDWVKRPVIHLSLSSAKANSPESLETDLLSIVAHMAVHENLAIKASNPSAFFRLLIEKLSLKYGQKTAVLIDEYDAPILANIDNPEKAKVILETLKLFYAALKEADNYRGLTFITGVTKFTRTSIFPTLNDLKDLTLEPEFANICGFTLEEFDTLFASRMKEVLAHFQCRSVMDKDSAVSDLRRMVLDWYDGYSWDGQSRVLNPWSILYFFDQKDFGHYWSQSGGISSFLERLFLKKSINIDSFINKDTISEKLKAIDLEKEIEARPVLFQTGYLTVSRVDETASPKEYFTGLPNLEIKASLIPLLTSLKPAAGKVLAILNISRAFLNSVRNLDPLGVKESLARLIQYFPAEIQEPSEAYYQALFHVATLMVGEDITVEPTATSGHIEAFYQAPDGPDFIIAMKYCSLRDKKGQAIKGAKRRQNIMESAVKAALKEIDLKKYFCRFRGANRPIYKTVLALNRREDVLFVFEKVEKDRILELDNAPIKRRLINQAFKFLKYLFKRDKKA